MSPSGSVSINPPNARARRGENITLRCTTRGGPDIDYIWVRNRPDLVNITFSSVISLSKYTLYISMFQFIFLAMSPEALSTTSTLTLTNISGLTHGSTYQCVAFRTRRAQLFGVGSTTVYVLPEIVTHPQNRFSPPGANVELTCIADAFPLPMYQWQKKNASSNEFEDIPGMNSSTLSFDSFAGSDFGTYRCVATNEIDGVLYNATSNEAIVTVSPLGITTLTPQNFTANVGNEVVLTCATTGGPNSHLFWNLNGSTVTSEMNDIVINSTQFESRLTINGVNATRHGGLYQCIAGNNTEYGSNSTFLFVGIQLLAQPQDMILTTNGSTVRLTCIADSFPVPQYSWSYQNIETGQTVSVDNSSDYQLVFDPIVFGQEGIYQCIVTSGESTIVSNSSTVYSKLLLLNGIVL